MITLKTLFGFFLFRRDAILSLSSSRSALWLGFLFVLSAGFAREYDSEYLVAEPWHLALPMVASLVGCSALLLLTVSLAKLRQVNDVGIFAQFVALLTVYWMMAPMAWMYAIPFERFMDPGAATRSNLTMLGIVSVWRVTLMIRCLSVLYNASIGSSMMPVMVFCLGMGYAAVQLIPTPVFLVMGGVKLTESERLILDLKLYLIAAGVLTSPIWGIGYLVACVSKVPWRWHKNQAQVSSLPVSRSAWALSFMSLVFWIPILPWTQSEQKLRWNAEKHLLSGSIQELCQLMRDHSERSFPPHWDPPPRLSYNDTKPGLFQTTAEILSNDPPHWFRKRYTDKIESATSSHFFYTLLSQMDNKEIAGLTRLVQDWKLIQVHGSHLIVFMEKKLSDPNLNDERRELLRNLMEALQHQEEKPAE